MTFVGKILVVVQVVLSVCFMAFAGAVYSVHQNWRTAYDNTKQQLATAQSQLQTQTQEFEAFKKTSETQLQAEQQRADRAEAAERTLTSQVAELESRVGALTSERNQLQTSAEVAAKEAQARREEALQLREINSSLHKSLGETLAKARSLEDQVYNKDLTIAQINDKHKSVLDQVADLERIIKLNNLEADPSAYEELQDPPPDVTGLVLNKRAGQGNRSELIEISLGSDDGLQRGHDLYVYRNSGDGKYLGRINLVYVTPDRAVGAVLEKSKNGVIEKGDHVTTKL